MKKVVLFLITCLMMACAGVRFPVKGKPFERQVHNNFRFSKKFSSFFNPNIVHRFRVIFHEDEWKKMLADIRKNKRTEIMRRAGFVREGSSAADTRVVIPNIGIRISGNTFSRRPPWQGDWDKRKGRFIKTKWKISFVKRFKKSDKRRPRHWDVRGLKLKNEHSDYTFRNEAYCFHLFNQAGILAPRFTWARFTLEITNRNFRTNVCLGLYKVFEPIDKAFVAKRFPDKSAGGNLYKCLWQAYGPADLTPHSIKHPRAIGVEDPDNGYHPAYDLKTNKKKNEHAALKRFIRRLNTLQGKEFERFIQNHFEVDLFLRTLAISVLSGMSDDYWNMGNNYYLYHDRHTDRWTFIPYDYDNTFGRLGLAQGNADKAPTYHRHIDRYGPTSAYKVAGRQSARPLVNKLLAIPRFRTLYHTYVDHLIKTGFKYETAARWYKKMGTVIRPWLKNDLQKTVRPAPINQDYFQRRVFTAARQLGKDVRQYSIGKYAKNIKQTDFPTDYSLYPRLSLITPSSNTFHFSIVHPGSKHHRYKKKQYFTNDQMVLIFRVQEDNLLRLKVGAWDGWKLYSVTNYRNPAAQTYQLTIDLRRYTLGYTMVFVDAGNLGRRRTAMEVPVFRRQRDYVSPQVLPDKVVFRFRCRGLKPSTTVLLKGNFGKGKQSFTMRYHSTQKLWVYELPRPPKGTHHYWFSWGRAYKIDPCNPRFKASFPMYSILEIGKAQQN